MNLLVQVVHGGEMATSAIVFWVVGAAVEGEPLQTRSIILQPRLNIVDTNVIDAATLFLGGVHPTEVLLGMAGNLHRCPSGNKVPRDIFPVATAKHK